MRILIEGFSGRAPKLTARNLAHDMAQEALNCRFDRARVEPIKSPTAMAAPGVGANHKTLFRTRTGTWLSWPEKRDVVRSPIANDPFQRIFMSVEGSFPRVRDYLGGEYRLGLPRPDTAPVGVPSVPVDNQSSDSLLQAERIYYRTTFVDAYGAEGPASLPSEAIDREINTAVTVTLPATPSGNYNFGTGALIRIYRSNQGTSAAAFQYVAEVPIGQAEFVDEIPNEELQELLPSATWIGPADDDTVFYPDGPLQGLTDMGNGVLAGFSGNTVMFSEPYVPHAWPIGYRLAVPENIIGITKIGGGLLVCTDGKPYMILGTNPQAMTLGGALPRAGTTDTKFPCASADSIVSFGEVAMYATTEGIVLAEGNSVGLITDALFDKTSWAAYLTELQATAHEGRYLGFNTGGGFIFDPLGGRNAFSELPDAALRSAAFFNDDGTNELYYISGADSVSRWEPAGGTPRSFVWRSKEFHLHRPNRFAAFRVEAETYPVTLTILDGSTTVHTETVTKEFGRLPSIRVTNPVIQLSGTNPVNMVAIATSKADLLISD